jgi:hypothetical protein
MLFAMAAIAGMLILQLAMPLAIARMESSGRP